MSEGEDVTEFVNSTPWQVAHTFDEFLDQVQGCFAEYYYVMKEGVWYAGAVYDTPGLYQRQIGPFGRSSGPDGHRAADRR